MRDKLTLTPTRLRIVLFSLIALLVIIGVGGSFFFQQVLSSYAAQVNKDAAAAVSSNQDITMLQHLKSEMADQQVAINRANSIVADSKYYQYQNQIIDDLSSYANKAGFNILGFSFDDPANPTAKTTTPPAASTPAAGASSAAGTTGTPAAATPVGLKSTSATISVPPNVSYQALMNFLRSIEDNLTKMDISSVSLTGTKGSQGYQSPTTIGPITLQVYTR